MAVVRGLMPSGLSLLKSKACIAEVNMTILSCARAGDAARGACERGVARHWLD